MSDGRRQAYRWPPGPPQSSPCRRPLRAVQPPFGVIFSGRRIEGYIPDARFEGAIAEDGLPGIALPTLGCHRLAVVMGIDEQRFRRAGRAPLAKNHRRPARLVQDLDGNAPPAHRGSKKIRIAADIDRVRGDVRDSQPGGELAQDFRLVGQAIGADTSRSRLGRGLSRRARSGRPERRNKKKRPDPKGDSRSAHAFLLTPLIHANRQKKSSLDHFLSNSPTVKPVAEARPFLPPGGSRIAPKGDCGYIVRQGIPP